MTVLLTPFSFLFWLVSSLRKFLYKISFLKSYDLGVPVISVGNITTGGTGKTPFVENLIELYEQKKMKVGVLTRGYGRKSKKVLEVTRNSVADDVGDEPLWLKSKHPEAIIAVGANRVAAFEYLKNKVDVVILDDGFQHYRIKRKTDIVLLDATANKNDLFLLPKGRARESLSSLKRADVVFLTKTNITSSEQLLYWRKKLADCGVKSSFDMEVSFKECINLKTNDLINLDAKKVVLCSAIANPLSFDKVVLQQKCKILFHKIFSDHHSYSEADVRLVADDALLAGAELLLITEKDAVKWSNAEHNIAIGVVKIKTNIPVGAQKWLGL